MLTLNSILSGLSSEKIDQVVAKGIVGGSHGNSGTNTESVVSMGSDSNSGSGTNTNTGTGS